MSAPPANVFPCNLQTQLQAFETHTSDRERFTSLPLYPLTARLSVFPLFSRSPNPASVMTVLFFTIYTRCISSTCKAYSELDFFLPFPLESKLLFSSVLLSDIMVFT